MGKSASVVVIGAGPAGLAAAYELTKQGAGAVVLEKDSVVGGLSRTVEYKGFRCDIGGHRFFTKISYVDGLWHEIMGQSFLRRPRLSRIYYRGKFYNYPLNVGNALKNLGPLKSLAVFGSLIRSKLLPYRPETSFTHWVSNRFGRRLFNMFFRTYTEKVWGISCDRLSADWAAQRIKNLSLTKAVLRAMGIGGKKAIASLIDEFNYPALGPGQLYETMADRAKAAGAELHLNSPVTRIEHDGRKVTAVCTGDGQARRFEVGRAAFSSMPLDELVLSLTPPPPAEVVEAARGLHYRSILTVNLLLNQAQLVPDNWIYIHDPHVVAGRMQLYKNWSPQMVPDAAQSVIGMEYFCTEGDELWTSPAERLVETATADLRRIGIADPDAVFDSFVVRYPKAYPVYDEGYAERLATIRAFLAGLANLYPVGRYGQFRYNNMDHSILTAHFSVRKLNGEDIDPWSVNTEAEYHEEKDKAE
ncbi:MAG TPA: NAD(P)/FAD-dependent oxidoreductase [Phycisphaerae bacterium]|nr:NAD(P)/FAD-dependent oxidoreductase [Phycisphaerae bacterium]HUT56769.1 NAD(P)/FAD-dependent oxidoreductase [Phycisphaerae bacterium]